MTLDSKITSKLHKIRQHAFREALSNLSSLDAQRSFMLKRLEDIGQKIVSIKPPRSGSILNFISQSEERALFAQQRSEILKEMEELEIKRAELSDRVMQANIELEKVNYLIDMQNKQARSAERLAERRISEQTRARKGS